MDSISSAVDPEQVKMLRATFDLLGESNLKWRNGLDRGLPKKYMKVTDVLRKVESEMKDFDQNESIPDDISIIESRINGHHEVFDRLKPTIAEFARLEKEATRDGVSTDQMKNIGQRLKDSDKKASERLSWLRLGSAFLIASVFT